jgi:signal transduction histidine kinase/CheY-like chemotaxis protein/HAMP domain-containing protein
MKIRNTSMGIRLAVGFSIIILFFILLGTVAYKQSERLWQITVDIYTHPLQVSKATRDIKADINSIHLYLKEIAIDPNLTEYEFEENISHIRTLESAIYKSFKVVNDNYLGPKSDVENAYILFKNWKPLRDKVIKLRKKGDHSGAYMMYKADNFDYREKMFAQIQVMIDFATAKSNEFFQSAEKEKKQILIWFRLSLLILSVLSVLIAFIFYKSIQTPLLALTRITDEYRQGNFNIRSSYHSTNEIGKLADAFNNMAGSVQQELVMKGNSASIAQLLINENELIPFCRELLRLLHITVNAQVTAIYFPNDLKTQFDHFESIGLDAGNCRSFAANTREGEFGAVLTRKEIVRITDIPDDSIFNFPTVTGTFKPREIITVPIVKDNNIIAIISLASIYEFSAESVKLLHEIQLMLTARLLGVLAFQEITDISLKLDQQNRDLEIKSKELSMQSDELKEYNIELKMQKKQVEEANQFKSAFLSNMSHELRTPLNSVIALSGVLSRKLNGTIPDDEYNYLGIIEKNGKQLLYLINDILDLSRIESGKEEINITRFNIFNLVQSIVESLQPIADEKGIRLINNIQNNLPEITNDSDKIHHIIQNIISNAVKFTEVGSINITAKRVDGELHISVADSGIGIDNDYLPLIFDEFRQADEKASRKYGGTGLGLAIAKKYALLLDGNISVKSKVGVGSVFTVKLPVFKEAATEKHNIPETSYNPSKFQDNNSEPEKGNGKTILLVEDSEPQIIQMSYILNQNGYTVRIAHNGKEALEAIEIMTPDAMILDLMMPEVDGFEVLDSIRSQKETSQIPVLILTAKHITQNELFFLKGNHIHQIIYKGVVNRSELLAHVHAMVFPQKTLDTAVPEKRSLSKPGKAVILVIEDNPDNMETVKALLADNYEIAEATNATEGITKARTQAPDLILLDISLPEMDGYAVFDIIRKDDLTRQIPVVALTAKAMKGDREELISYGFDGYISKPIDNILMHQTINTLLNEK